MGTPAGDARAREIADKHDRIEQLIRDVEDDSDLLFRIADYGDARYREGVEAAAKVADEYQVGGGAGNHRAYPLGMRHRIAAAIRALCPRNRRRQSGAIACGLNTSVWWEEDKT